MREIKTPATTTPRIIPASALAPGLAMYRLASGPTGLGLALARDLVRVMGGWYQPNYNRALLEHNGNHQGVDALAMPTYVGGYIPSNLNNPQILQSWLDQGGQSLALDRIFQELLDGNALRPYYLPGGAYYDPARPAWQIPPANGAIQAMLDQMATNVALAREFGLSPVSYEGGHHLDVTVNGNSTAIRDLILAAGRDPRMGTAFQRSPGGLARDRRRDADAVRQPQQLQRLWPGRLRVAAACRAATDPARSRRSRVRSR